ncbi:hypothetical protein C1645_839422 [Glomus cerebriforme]|uniref:Uncharacterized protein n=1 Tax=Glomus cerebriforme TaxID=658196 RepID=A0A397S223_9GLOM|nr:hypothetical protein C1645_839422 [Glomus cerebriforme]
MNLTNLFRGYRHSEPTIILRMKIFAMIVLVACLTGYVVILINDVLRDEPVIKISYKYYASLRPPNVIFQSPYNFTLSCTENRITLNLNATSPDCTSDITQPDEKYGPGSFYYGFYQPSEDFIDSEYDPITERIKEKNYFELDDDSIDLFDILISRMNEYGLAANQVY